MASRTCTILFTDLVGSTELRTRLGDDGFDARRREHDRLLLEAIERYSGELVKHEGDGVMAVFTSAADALSCGVAGQQAIARDNRRHDAPLDVRVGVSAGDVVEEDGDYHGTPVVEAARLCNAASGGQIVAADVVRALAGSRGGHQFVSLGALELKGLSEPVTAWEVRWATDDGAAEIPVRLGEVAARGACVGRDAELQSVVTAWKSAATGERRLVLVAGEPGIGKTRLAAELAARVVAHGGIALHGWCDEDLGSPYQPWAQALGAYVRASAPEDLVADLGAALPDLARLVPEVAERVDVSERPAADAETERARLFDAVDLLIERVTARVPMLIVLDDVHWADRPTLGLLRRVLQSDRPGAVLILATYRDTDVDRRHPLSDVLADLRREPRVSRVVLGGLDESGLGAMLADRAGHEAPEEFVRLLLDETEGNPFFVEEVVAHLVETGTIYQREGVWVSDLDPDDIGLPEGVRDVIGRRLSQLPDAANALLTVAAVVGRDFDVTTVIAAGGVERDEALDSLDAALETGLVGEVKGFAGRYSFSHALVRQTLLEELRGARRARLHWRVGEALATRRDPQLSAIAFHLCEGVLAGDASRAAEAAVLAAEQAFAMAAPEDARMLAQRSLDVLADAEEAEPQLRCRALLVIGETAGVAGRDIESGRTAIKEAALLAREHGWSELVMRAAVTFGWLQTPGAADPFMKELAKSALELGGDDAWRAALIGPIAAFELNEGNWETGLPLLAELDAAAQQPDASPLLRVQAATARGFFEQGMPDLDNYEKCASATRAFAEELGSPGWLGLGHLQQAMAALRAGDRERLEREHEAFVEVFADSWREQPDSMMLEGSIALLDGRFADAEQLAFRVFAATDQGAPNFLNAAAQIAAILYWTGRDDELLSALEAFPVEQRPQRHVLACVRVSTRARRGERDDAIPDLIADDFGRIPLGWARSGSLAHLSYAAAWLDDASLAQPMLDLIEPYSGQFFCSAAAALVYDAVDSLRGMLLHVLGRVDEAIACHEEAAKLCEKARDVPHATMNKHRLARALLTRDAPGDRERARTLATESLAHATTLGQTPDVRFAQAVLDEL